MAKLWEITFRVRNRIEWIAATHNAQTRGLGEDIPNLDEVRAALPHYAKHMEMIAWSTRADIGPSVYCEITLLRSNGNPYHKRVYCRAYEFPPKQ